MQGRLPIGAGKALFQIYLAAEAIVVEEDLALTLAAESAETEISKAMAK
jgi:hypothetical protein